MPSLELEAPHVDNAEAHRFLQTAKDISVSASSGAARFFGHDDPRPAKRLGYDHSLKNTSILAYYLDPAEVEQHYPLEGRKLRALVGPEPVVGLNPEIVKIDKKYRGFGVSVIEHEATHGGQKGKLALKQIHALTQYGTINLGEAIIEGATEYSLEKRGKKPPSRFMEEMSDSRPLYSVYKDMVYEMEASSPGILRQIFRAAHSGGAGAALRLIKGIPNMENIVDKYAWKLARRSYAN